MITTEEFIFAYSKAIKNETGSLIDLKIFDVLEDLFEDIDAFSPRVPPENETPLLISEITLRKEAKIAIDKINEAIDENELICD